MKFISLCFANVVNIKGICNKKNRKKGLTASKSVFYKKKSFQNRILAQILFYV